MKEKKQRKKGRTLVAFLLALLFAVSVPTQEAQAAEYNNENSTLTVVVTNRTQEYDLLRVQPRTTMFNCQIIMAFKADEGLSMTFTTSCAGEAKVIGVKDIKVQQKMWYGWKTVFISDGAESYNCAIFAADLNYPDAIKDKTYRVICTHYADADGYEEAENDTGAFKFTY